MNFGIEILFYICSVIYSETIFIIFYYKLYFYKFIFLKLYIFYYKIIFFSSENYI